MLNYMEYFPIYCRIAQFPFAILRNIIPNKHAKTAKEAPRVVDHISAC